eukprot:1580694-Rhodomonas_salina.1
MKGGGNDSRGRGPRGIVARVRAMRTGSSELCTPRKPKITADTCHHSMRTPPCAYARSWPLLQTRKNRLCARTLAVDSGLENEGHSPVV